MAHCSWKLSAVKASETVPYNAELIPVAAPSHPRAAAAEVAVGPEVAVAATAAAGINSSLVACCLSNDAWFSLGV